MTNLEASAIDVSVVIVSWNAKDYLVKCLESIEATRDELSVEIIVVDNGSHDGSPQAVGEHFPAVQLIETGENLGFAKANNVGLRAAQGRYLCLVNSDVEVLPGCFQQLIDDLEAQPRIGIAGPRVLNADRTLQHSCRTLPTALNVLARALALDTLFPRSEALAGSFMFHWNHDERRNVGAISGCFWIVRREALDAVGLLDEIFFIYSEDVDWCKRFHDGGWDVTLLPAAEAIHYGGASSGNAPLRFFLEMQKAKWTYWKKHHGALSLVYYWAVTLLHHKVRLGGGILSLLVPRSDKQKSRAKIEKHLACIRWLLGLGGKPRPDA